MTDTYIEIPAAEVPDGLIWTVPGSGQGQVVEVAYSRGIPAGRQVNYEAGHGDPYMRETDGADGTVTYYKRAAMPKAPVIGDTPWGIAEIAEWAGVKRATVDQWRWGKAGKLPEPDGTMSGRPYWWRSRLLDHAGIGGNRQTKLMYELAGAVMARLEEAAGWVTYDELLTLAPGGRNVVVPELEGEEAFGADYGHGGAYDAGPSGKPDGGMLVSAIAIVRRRLEAAGETLDEGYPRGTDGHPGERSLRVLLAPDDEVPDVPDLAVAEGEAASAEWADWHGLTERTAGDSASPPG